MGMPAAVQGDKIVGSDTHILLVPSPTGPVPTPLPHPFSGMLDGGLCPTVKIGGKAAAVVGSTATNLPAHIPANPAAPFQKQPTNRATVQMGSTTVKLGGKFAARAGDPALTCNDPADAPMGKVMAAGVAVKIG